VPSKFVVFFCDNCGAVVNILYTEFRGSDGSDVMNDVVPCCGDPHFVYRHYRTYMNYCYEEVEGGIELDENITPEPVEKKVGRFDFIMEDK